MKCDQLYSIIEDAIVLPKKNKPSVGLVLFEENVREIQWLRVHSYNVGSFVHFLFFESKRIF